MPDLSYEIAAQSKGFKLICGVDEAGRGPLAGPVCAAAVILPENCDIEGLNDSKKLSEKKREALFNVIKEKALAYSIAFGTLEEIEEFNILEATFIAMNRAIDGLEIPAVKFLSVAQPRGSIPPDNRAFSLPDPKSVPDPLVAKGKRRGDERERKQIFSRIHQILSFHW